MLNKIDMFTISGDDGLEVSLKEKKELTASLYINLNLDGKKRMQKKILNICFHGLLL